MNSRVKKIFTLTTIILFIFIIGAVSASENLTDENLTMETPREVIKAPQDDINVTFDEQMWQENLSDIDVELPESASGSFAVKINDEVIYNQTITNKSFKVPIKLPKSLYDFYVIKVYPPIDFKSYRVNAFYNGIDLNLNKTLRVMKYSPDFNYLDHFPQEILQNDNYYSVRYSLLFPQSANGYVEIYIDNKLLNKTKVNGPYLDFNASKITSLALGNHTLKILYYNDTYYNPFNRTFNFTIVNVTISIPHTVNINHDDCISVNTVNDIAGRVKVYVDGKLISNEKYEKYYVFSLADYVRSNSTEVKVEFEGKNLSRTKTQKINVTYDFDIYQLNEMIYGEDKIIEIDLPNKLNNNLLSVKINGTKFRFKTESDDVGNVIVVDISKLQSGSYQMVISYSGDDRFDAKTNTFNFTIDYYIFTEEYIEFGDGSKVSLKLPAAANGNLKVYINGKPYKSVKMNEGKANIKVDDLNPGDYDMYVEYSGADFKVSSRNTTLYVYPNIRIDTYFKAGEKKSLTLKVPSKCKGTMTVTVDGKKHTVKVKNGKATYSLKNLKVGEHFIKIDYKGSDGYKYDDYYYVEVVPSKIKIRAENADALYNHKFKYKVKLLGKDAKALKNKWVKFKIAKKTYKAKTNKKGVATVKLSGLKLKTYKIKISYSKVKVTKKIRVKLLKVDVKKTGSKIKFKAKLFKALKSKTVTFKVAKKKYEVKTNSKGVAKLTVKNLKKAKTVKYQVVYNKSTVKGSIKN